MWLVEPAGHLSLEEPYQSRAEVEVSNSRIEYALDAASARSSTGSGLRCERDRLLKGRSGRLGP